MRPVLTRLDLARAVSTVVVGVVAFAGCDDNATSSRRYITLTQPVTVRWQGSGAVISAAAQLRVDWMVFIDNVPADSGQARARHRSTYDDQEMIAFTWNLHNNVGSTDFTHGDSCVVRVSYPQLDPAEPGASTRFRLP